MKLIVLLLIVSTLAACNNSYTVKMIKTGGIVQAHNPDLIDLGPGDTVCLQAHSFGHEWSIVNDGHLQDTMYLASDTMTIIEFRTGVILR